MCWVKQNMWAINYKKDLSQIIDVIVTKPGGQKVEWSAVKKMFLFS